MKQSVHQILRERLLHRAGLFEFVLKPKWTLQQLENEWSPEFERFMRNRLMMGALRYGPLRRSSGSGYDYIGSAKERLDLYKATGNQEHLVDVANICLALFMTDNHPKKHFGAADDGVHASAV
jgi:hypothetical protein